MLAGLLKMPRQLDTRRRIFLASEQFIMLVACSFHVEGVLCAAGVDYTGSLRLQFYIGLVTHVYVWQASARLKWICLK
jgi:hypothetical protein